LFSERTKVCANSLLLLILKEIMIKCAAHSSFGDLVANISPLTDIIFLHRLISNEMLNDVMSKPRLLNPDLYTLSIYTL
jgi:hypothetical protein